MNYLNKEVSVFLEKSSWIRKMFEAGLELKKKYGEDNVFDFSLGNPDLPSPKKVKDALYKIADMADQPYAFGYMPNAGSPETREKLANYLTKEQGIDISPNEVMLTCGAAGGLNCLFRAILEPGDEVICLAPYFVEYGFYLSNHRAMPRIVETRGDFSLDIQKIGDALDPKVRAVLINSPNNPTGQVYSFEELKALGEILDEYSKKFNVPIYLISDEPYRFLTYDDVYVPSVLKCYKNSIVVSSFSKNMSLAGERIGYVAISPFLDGKEDLMNGLIFVNRILGYVNAPTIGQKILNYALGDSVDIEIYNRRRKLMAKVLKDAGYDFVLPKGGFYFFPKSPIEDEVEFVKILQENRILAVPGSGFGKKGYFRLCFCVSEKAIENSYDGFKNAINSVR